EAERGDQAPIRELVDRRELLREQHRISSWEHYHAGAELEAVRAPRDRRERSDRSQGAAARTLGEPDRVPAERFTRVDDRPEPGAVESGAGRRAETETDLDLHRAVPGALELCNRKPPPRRVLEPRASCLSARCGATRPRILSAFCEPGSEVRRSGI